jgi:hypothetical protein
MPPAGSRPSLGSGWHYVAYEARSIMELRLPSPIKKARQSLQQCIFCCDYGCSNTSS